jgi:hypothetical protein
MKKIANYLIALAVAAFTFTSCEDVPSPFGTVVQPDSGEEVVIEPTGNGTEADPYNVAAVLEYISGLGVGVQSDKEFYVKGIISEVKEVQTTGTYGNATYWISDDADGKANKFYIYRGYGLGGKKFTEGATPVQAGDNVVIKSKVMNYNGTYETVQNNCIIVELNGTKDSGGGGDTPTSDLGTKDAPITVAKALETINKLADGGETGEAYVKGTISKVQSYNSQYKSITYYISDDGKETNELQVYSGKGLNGADFAAKEDLAAGDVVVIKGKLKKFVKNETITPEINQSSEIISLTKGSGGGGDTPTSDLGTKDAPITVAKALETINSLADGGETEEAYVKGIISKVQSYNSKYKSITYYISDDGKEANELQVYSGKGLNGADFAAKEDLAAGDVVVIKGKLKKYVKDGTVTPEINQSSEIITLTKGGGSDTPSGTTGLEQSFEAGKGDFTIEDKSIGEGITYVWSEDTKNKYMKASAYKGGCIAAESWLVSPAFSLKGITAPVMTFNNACNQVKEGNITDHIKVMVYDGANWTEATISGMPDGKSWTFVDSTVDLKSVAGKTNVKVAFKYVSTAAFAPTWEIKNVSIK